MAFIEDEQNDDEQKPRDCSPATDKRKTPVLPFVSSIRQNYVSKNAVNHRREDNGKVPDDSRNFSDAEWRKQAEKNFLKEIESRIPLKSRPKLKNVNSKNKDTIKTIDCATQTSPMSSARSSCASLSELSECEECGMYYPRNITETGSRTSQYDNMEHYDYPDSQDTHICGVHVYSDGPYWKGTQTPSDSNYDLAHAFSQAGNANTAPSTLLDVTAMHTSESSGVSSMETPGTDNAGSTPEDDITVRGMPNRSSVTPHGGAGDIKKPLHGFFIANSFTGSLELLSKPAALSSVEIQPDEIKVDMSSLDSVLQSLVDVSPSFSLNDDKHSKSAPDLICSLFPLTLPGEIMQTKSATDVKGPHRKWAKSDMALSVGLSRSDQEPDDVAVMRENNNSCFMKDVFVAKRLQETVNKCPTRQTDAISNEKDAMYIQDAISRDTSFCDDIEAGADLKVEDFSDSATEEITSGSCHVSRGIDTDSSSSEDPTNSEISQKPTYISHDIEHDDGAVQNTDESKSIAGTLCNESKEDATLLKESLQAYSCNDQPESKLLTISGESTQHGYGGYNRQFLPRLQLEQKSKRIVHIDSPMLPARPWFGRSYSMPDPCESFEGVSPEPPLRSTSGTKGVPGEHHARTRLTRTGYGHLSNLKYAPQGSTRAKLAQCLDKFRMLDNSAAMKFSEEKDSKNVSIHNKQLDLQLQLDGKSAPAKGYESPEEDYDTPEPDYDSETSPESRDESLLTDGATLIKEGVESIMSLTRDDDICPIPPARTTSLPKKKSNQTKSCHEVGDLTQDVYHSGNSPDLQTKLADESSRSETSTPDSQKKISHSTAYSYFVRDPNTGELRPVPPPRNSMRKKPVSEDLQFVDDQSGTDRSDFSKSTDTLPSMKSCDSTSAFSSKKGVLISYYLYYF